MTQFSYPYGSTHVIQIIVNGEIRAEQTATSQHEAIEKAFLNAKDAVKIGASILVSPLNIDFNGEFDGEGE